MTNPELHRLVSQGEGQFLEFKNRTPEPLRLAREMVAFANGKGGIILIGIDDNGDVLGVKDLIEERFAIDQALENHCSVPLTIEYSSVSVSRKRSVIVLHIKESIEKPVYVVDSDLKVATIRVDDKAVDSSREMRRILKHENSESDVSFIYGSKEEILMKYLDDHDSITVKQFAELTNVPHKLASHTLVLLTKAEILKIIPQDNKEDLFRLNEKA